VTVYTNRDDARFVVRDVADGRVLGAGEGKAAQIVLDTSKGRAAYVEFLDILVEAEKNSSVSLRADRGAHFEIAAKKTGSHKEVGHYQVR
jgi:hypothetical protein